MAEKPTPLNKKNLEDHLIEADLHFSIFEPLCIKFGLNQQRIVMALNEKHAPKPDKLESKALYSMRRHKGWDYNIFKCHSVPGQATLYYAGIVFDRYRRPYYQTLAFPETTEKAIDMARNICELLSKGQCVPYGFKLDEGKAIREREEGTRKNAAIIRRKGGTKDV